MNYALMNYIKTILFVFAMLMLAGCESTSQPKPRGYYRIDLPQHEYVSLQSAAFSRVTGALPYTFDVNRSVTITEHPDGEQHWIDIRYPDFNVNVHCSYKPVQHNLRELSDDAQRFVYNHAGKASAIPEQGFDNAEEHVHGVMYELVGNTASPCQFYMTDSLHHFFRAAVYFNCIPNQDSLAPVRDYLIDDIRHMVETMKWRNR